VSPFRSNGLLAPSSKYKTVSFAPTDDPFLDTPAPKETDADADADSSSDVEMPGIGAILAEKQARDDHRTRQEKLQQLKLAALEKQKKTDSANDTEDSDDGLDVVPDTMHSVAREEAAARASAGRTRPSAGRNAQLRFAGVAPSPQRPALLPTQSPEKRMAAAARPAFLAPSARDDGAAGIMAGRGKRGGMTKAELDQMMLQNAEVQSEGRRKEKEEEWVRRGGRVTGVMEDVGSENLQALVEKVREQSGGADTQDGEDEDDNDADDGDYVPVERGSASPEPMEAQEGHDNQKTTAGKEMAHEAEHRVADFHIAEAAADTDSEMESSAPDVHLRRPRAARPRRAVIGSDDEGADSGAENAVEEDVHPPPLSLPDLASPAFPSPSPWLTRHPGPDNGDEKENDPDVSGNDTDKENRAVVCRAPLSSAPVQGARVLFDDILGARSGSTASVQPLQLLGEDDPFVFTPSPVKAREDALRRLSSPTPARVFGTSGKRGLSQMFEEEEDGAPIPQGGNDDAARGNIDPGLVAFNPALGGLSQAFEQTQVRPFHVQLPATRSQHVRRTSMDLGLAQVASPLCDAAVTPSFRSHLMHRLRLCSPRWRSTTVCVRRQPRYSRRNKSTWSKRRSRPVQDASYTSLRTGACLLSASPSVVLLMYMGPLLFFRVAAHRFLTQTRPEGSSSPLIYRPSPSQRPYDALLRTQSGSILGTAHSGTAASSPLTARQPLSTLAEMSPLSSVGREPLRRLRRAHTSPEAAPVTSSERRYAYPRGQSLSPSPSPSPARTKGGATPTGMMMQGRTAFSELMLGAKLAVHRDSEKAKAKKRSEFVEDQAVESDEDDMLGFGGVRKKNGDEDDEDDEHDADGVIKDLVDDAQMDESALAKSKVLEKHLCVSPFLSSRVS
jgi:mediator of replication checkpoint protein 1